MDGSLHLLITYWVGANLASYFNLPRSLSLCLESFLLPPLNGKLNAVHFLKLVLILTIQ